MATLTKRGLASVTGCTATFDVITYPVQQSIGITHQFDVEIIKDAQGQDVAKNARNETLDGEIMMKLLGDTAAHAKAAAVFLAPLAVITISASDVTPLGTTATSQQWQLIPGSKIDLKNVEVGNFELKLMRYVDSTQNTAMMLTPS